MDRLTRLQTGPLRPLLWCAAKLYSVSTHLRNLAFDLNIIRSYTGSLPVVSIGNLTAGGNGKTPLAIAVAEGLRERGYRPVVLSRGYGGSECGPHVVSPGDLPARVGDEPLMVARRGYSVVVARKRAEGAKLIEFQALGDVIILDDGFQHRYLSRTIDVLSIDVGGQEAIDRFITGEVLPLGLFREDRRRALSRVDAVLLSQRAITDGLRVPDPKIVALLPKRVKIYRSSLESTGFFECSSGRSVVQPKDAVAFSGLASPAGFYDTLRALGVRVLAERSFPDHHPFAEEEIRELRSAFPSLPLICTEKDAVKVGRWEIEKVYYLQVKAKIDPRDAFFVQIERALLQKKRAL